MTPEMATNLLAYDTYTQTSGSPMARLCKANQEAVKTLRKHGDQAVCPCFRHLTHRHDIPMSPACKTVLSG